MPKETSAYSSKVVDWEKEIKSMMKDFKFNKNEINYVLEKAKQEFKDDSTKEQKYNIAWRKFMSLSRMTIKERKELCAGY